MTTETTAQTGTGTETAAPETPAVETTTTETTASSATATTETKAAETPSKDATLLSGAEVGDKPVAAAAGYWQPDWRQELVKQVGGDKKLEERLGRFGSPSDILKSYLSLEKEKSSGQLKRELPENATEEQKAEWRKEMGLPEKADDYLDKLTLPDGVVLGEMDKPVAAAFAEAAHAGDLKPEQYSKLVAKYYEIQDQKNTAQYEADEQYRQATNDALNAEWGHEFRPNINAVKNFLAGMPEAERNKILEGRDADGRKIGDNPVFVRYLAQMARELNPAATLVPATGDIGKSVDARLGELKVMIKDRSSEYYHGPNSAKLKAEYRQLLDAQDKMKSRAA